MNKPLLLLLLMAAIPAANADSKFYVGGAIGSAELDDSFNGFNFDSSAIAFRISAGWRFNDYFAAELGYLDFGDFEEDFDVLGDLVPASVSANGFTFGVSGALPVSDNFALTGRAGMFFWNGTATLNGVTEASPDDTNPYFAAGARYRFTERFSVVGDFTYYDLEQTESSVISVGIEVDF